MQGIYVKQFDWSDPRFAPFDIRKLDAFDSKQQKDAFLAKDFVSDKFKFR